LPERTKKRDHENLTMPRMKLKPKTRPASKTSAEVLTLAEAAAYLRLPEVDVVRLVKEQGLPGRHLGDEWRFLLAGIRDWLARRSQRKSNKDAWRELAGVWKDDPYFDEMLNEINGEREHHPSEDR
jgi:excisionase family DNA binding protein